LGDPGLEKIRHQGGTVDGAKADRGTTETDLSLPRPGRSKIWGDPESLNSFYVII
jgi:hypothetical protein